MTLKVLTEKVLLTVPNFEMLNETTSHIIMHFLELKTVQNYGC